jgi:predicted metalloprotease
MKWDDREESQNVEDQRGMGKTVGMAAGGGSILVVILALIFGFDPRQLFNGGGGGPGPAQPNGQQEEEEDQPKRKVDPAEEKLAHFTKVIFHDTEVIWDKQFRKLGKTYKKPTLVLFSGQVKSACGLADAAVGPFYCPGDGKVYIDLSFYQDMQKKLNAPGEFARAYVVAHEVGHHVQKLLGYSARVDEARERGSKVEANHMSVRLELQADYLAGVWAHYGQEEYKFLDPGDLESALNAAFEIGDDRLQKQARGRVVPDSFTHGTSKQRMRWFKQGFETGDVGKASLLFDLRYDEL